MIMYQSLNADFTYVVSFACKYVTVNVKRTSVALHNTIQDAILMCAQKLI